MQVAILIALVAAVSALFFWVMWLLFIIRDGQESEIKDLEKQTGYKKPYKSNAWQQFKNTRAFIYKKR